MENPPRVFAAAGLANLLLVLASLAVLGWLTMRRLPFTPAGLAGLLFGFLLLCACGLALLSGMLSVLNPALVRMHGGQAGLVAVVSGMLLIVPFTVLALIADLGLGWSAAQTFATAGVMTGSAAVGMEMSKLGLGRLANSVVPSLAGGLFVVVWMLLNALLQAVSH